ncbi:MAG: 23S rRNA (uracil(1939)-C(5))-methyltransferase RlmD [Candidatus Margulisiibacteriota bacterium]
MLKKNKLYKGNVTQQGKLGEGIIVFDECPVYIPNTIPGDRVVFKLLKLEKRRAFGKLIEILLSSPDRVSAPCSVAMQCGGCQLQHQSKDAQLGFKFNLLKSRLSRFIDIDEIQFLPVLANDVLWGTRNKMQFAFSNGSDGVAIGLYAHRSHRVIDFDYCHVMSSSMNQVVRAIKAWVNMNLVSVFDEHTGQGVLRHLTLRTSHVTGQIMIILTLGDMFDMRSFVTAISQVAGVASIYVSVQSDKTNDQVMGDELHHIWGALVIDDVVHGCKCQVSPKSFMQANGSLVNKLYKTVIDSVLPSDVILDLYCGTGVMTCALAKYFDHVVGVDNNVSAIEDAKRNAEENRVNVQFFCEDVVNYISNVSLGNATVILDPPRQGCSEHVIKSLIQIQPKQIIYVSCYPDTLGRDLRAFTSNGFRVQSVQAVDMFCHTPHVEAVAKLELT